MNSDQDSQSSEQELRRLGTVQIRQLLRLCSETGITIATLSSTLWALILALFLDREDVCFGYLASGRDIDVPGVQDMLGPL
ncbi:putative Carrier domain-containing protein, partial [Seiridium unicorne]